MRPSAAPRRGAEDRHRTWETKVADNFSDKLTCFFRIKQKARLFGGPFHIRAEELS
jgi:hypothetical protein